MYWWLGEKKSKNIDCGFCVLCETLKREEEKNGGGERIIQGQKVKKGEKMD